MSPSWISADVSLFGPIGQFDNAVFAIRLLFLPCPLLTLHHHFSQDQVDSRLVARAFGLKPIHNLEHPRAEKFAVCEDHGAFKSFNVSTNRGWLTSMVPCFVVSASSATM